MGKIKQKKLCWERSNNPDVISYKVYWSEDDRIDYGSSHALVADVAELLLPDDLVSFPLIKRRMTLGISAVDSAGNESDITTVSVDLDFTVPDAPQTLRIEDLQDLPASPKSLRVEDL